MTVKPTTITATYRIVTPMFCSGANQQSAELRLASFKGALRFWWRTLMAGKFGNDIDALHRAEASLFGSSEREFGQSKVRLRLRNVQLAPQVNPPEIFERGVLLGTHYLGYGLMEAYENKKKGKKAGQLTRGMIPFGSFSVDCRVSGGATDEQIEHIKASLTLLGTLGGLGSRSRKGFGSLTLTQLSIEESPLVLVDDPATRLANILAVTKLSTNLSEWTSWSDSKHCRIVRVKSEQVSANALLDAVGREQAFFRSWGSNNQGKLSEHRTLGIPSEQNFEFDHHLFKKKVSGNYPHRIAFGLPHNYGKFDDQHVSTANKKLDRRASPLFIHIHQTSQEAAPSALLVFLPSRFLPADEEVSAFGKRSKVKDAEPLWYPVHGFLDRMISDGSKPDERPGYELFPDDSTWWKKQNQSLNATEVKFGR